ncbi:MAG: NAD(P)/FAD-dependent oxidoreductase [Candidatus Bathyarchaeia archaeon]|jgi:geranylgeranyl reductase family protein
MNESSDVIVVGAGPSGSFTALKLAKLGRSVTVFEEHSQVGVPSHCAGHLSMKGLKQLGLHPLPPEIVENTFYGANFFSSKGNRFSVRLSQPVTCAVDRVRFDEYIAEKAQDAGAGYSLNSRVEALIIKNAFAEGAVVKQEETAEKRQASVVVDAEGISSTIIREAGLPRPQKFVKGVEADVENVKDAESDAVDVYLGNSYAPGFYGWLIPKKDGTAKVGLAARTGNPKELLQKLMLKHPAASKKLRSARTLKATFHPITLGGPTAQAYSNGFLAVGDAASQVKPTTGGGVILGMTCARVAAEVASEALDRNDFSKEFLAKYQNRCRELLGFDMKIMLRMRRTLDALSDEKVDEAIAMCAKFGLDKTLQNVKDIDFQGQTVLHVLRSPRMLTALAYFFFANLSANL